MIDGIQQFGVFVAAGLLLNLTPGADMALVASRSAGQGWRAGAAAALGVGLGCFVHIGAAALGLAALLASTPAAFGALRWLGAAWLVWLGWGMLTHRAAPPVDLGVAQAGSAGPAGPTPAVVAGPERAAGAAGAAGAGEPAGRWRSGLWQGFLTNALNPKVALFFLAFMPQFIAADAPHKRLAFVLLGLVFVVNGTLVNLAVAALVAGLRRRWAGQARWAALGRWLNRGVGTVFVALGLRLALAGQIG